MALSNAEKQTMISASRDMAWHLVEDLEYMREILAKPEPSPRDLRHLSNVLRRLLIDNNGDLRKIAGPRIGRIHLLAPDILRLFRSGEKQPYTFLSAGVADVFGIQIDAWMVEPGSHPREVEGYQPGRTVEVRIDGFLSQKIICLKGQWVSRAECIKYVANVAGGVHSGSAKEPVDELLRLSRHVATISLSGEMPTLTFKIDAPAIGEKPISINLKALDFVLIQLLSAARYLTLSQDILRLEDIIKAEHS